MAHPLVEIFRNQFQPLQPVATGESPVLSELEGVRAVLFDLYGTLFISASGEVGATREAACGSALAGALRAMGMEPKEPLDRGVECYLQAIEVAHAKGRVAGIDHPEIDIVALWPQILSEMAKYGMVEASVSTIDAQRFAVEYEARANPCWSMPHLEECLNRLQRKGLLLGIISNAQFYTPLLFEALLGQPGERWGVDPELEFYSYQHERAKPGMELYQMAVEALDSRGVRPREALYIGNDMLNDIYPAFQVGFRTGLFAGDARSLRRREGSPQVEGIEPDLVLTDLAELVHCINV